MSKDAERLLPVTQPAQFLMTASIAFSAAFSGADLLFGIFARSQATPY